MYSPLSYRAAEQPTDVRPILRQAREQALEREQLTDNARAVQVPAADVARAVGDLERAGVSAGQQPAFDDLVRSVTRLREVVAALPPTRVRRKR